MQTMPGLFSPDPRNSQEIWADEQRAKLNDDADLRKYFNNELVRDHQAIKKSYRITDDLDPEPEPESGIKELADRLLPTREDDRNAPPPVWLIGDLIQEDRDALLVAPKEYLKSFVGLEIGYCVATGHKVFGKLPVINSGPVIYFCGEGYNSMRKVRRAAWEIAHGYQPFTVPDIYFAGGLPVVNDKDVIHQYIEAIKYRLGDRQPSLFIIDTLNRCLDGEVEDYAHTAALYLNTLKTEIREQFGGGATLTIGHKGKDQERGLRGSSAFTAGFDTVIDIIRHIKNEDSHLHTIEIKVENQKDGESGARYFLQSRRIETPDGLSLALTPCDEKDVIDALTEAKEPTLTAAMVEEVLHQELAGGGHIGTGQLKHQIATRFNRTEKSVHSALMANKAEGQRFHRFVYNGTGNRKHSKEVLWYLPTLSREPHPLSDGQIDRFMDDATAKFLQ
jgi:hypothetical protein